MACGCYRDEEISFHGQCRTTCHIIFYYFCILGKNNPYYHHPSEITDTGLQNENYGDSRQEKTNKVPAQNALKTVFTDRRILTIGLASCFFEGSMYLFVFFWTPALKAAQSNHSSSDRDLPLGLIFACFMASVMLGKWRHHRCKVLYRTNFISYLPLRHIPKVRPCL